MAINGVGGAYNNTNVNAAQYETAKSNDKASVEEKSKENNVNVSTKDKKVSVEQDKSGVTYYDPATINKLKSEVAAKYDNLKSLVENIILKQGEKGKKAGYNNQVNIDSILKTKEDAASEIADDGYWGVEATANRILGFAQSLSNDPAMLDTFKDAFIEGYKAAEKAFGGQLPDICKKTYDAVIKGFDDLKNKSAEATATA